MAVEYDHARPWVRQPFDTDLSWALFLDYLTQPPPRRIADLARRPGFPLPWNRLEALAWEDGWKARADAWDRHLDAQRLATIERVIQEDAAARAQRQGRVGKKLQRLAELEVDRVVTQVERQPGFDHGIQLRDVIRAAAIGVRIERLALGDSTEKVETGPDLSNLTVEQLRQLREIQEKAGSNDP